MRHTRQRTHHGRTSGHTPPNPPTTGFPATQAQTHTTQPPNPLSSLSLTPPFPHIPPTLTHIKIPEADRLRDFLLYQAQCDPHHSGGSDERSRGKGLFAQAQARQLSQEQRTQDCGGNGVSTAAGEYRIGAEPHTRRQDQPGQTGLDALERCPYGPDSPADCGTPPIPAGSAQRRAAPHPG